MPAINNHDINTRNSKTYPENGKSPTKWGTHYDREVRVRIVNDILSGAITIEEMGEMLNLGLSYIKDWQKAYRPDVYGPPRSRPGKAKFEPKQKTYGTGLDCDAKRSIVQAIISGQTTVERASNLHNVYPSRIEYWMKCGRYNNRPAITAPAPKLTDAERLSRNPEYSKVVLDLLLTGKPEAALMVDKAFLVTR